MMMPQRLLSGFFLCLSLLPVSDNREKSAYILQEPVAKTSAGEMELVQIAVTDEMGNPITDLRQEDFFLSKSGLSQELTHFENHRPDAANIERATRLPTNEAGSPLLARRLVFLFDFAFNNEAGLLIARDAALRFIKNCLLPSDEIGVMTFFGRRYFRSYEFPTKDRSKLVSLVESFDPQDLNAARPLNPRLPGKTR